MVLSRVPELIRASDWATVRDVPDASRFDVRLTVGFRRPVTDADVERFAELGGRVDYRFTSFPALSGALPDRSIPAYQADPDVTWIELATVICLAG